MENDAPSSDEAREALAMATDSRHRMADALRRTSPPWYAPVYGLLVAVAVMAFAAPPGSPLFGLVIAGAVAGLVLLVWLGWRATGVWIGPRRGRPLALQVGVGVLAALAMATCFLMGRAGWPGWIQLLLATGTGAAAWQLSMAWDRAYLRDLKAGA